MVGPDTTRRTSHFSAFTTLGSGLDGGTVGAYHGRVTNSNDTEALARRLVACPHFGWVPGMLDMLGQRITEENIGDALDYANPIPDLDDPTTLWCVLELWWEAWPAECDDRARMCAEIQDAIVDIDRDKLARALVAALEAAPPREAGR